MASTNLWRLSVESYCAPYAWLRYVAANGKKQLKYILNYLRYLYISSDTFDVALHTQVA